MSRTERSYDSNRVKGKASLLMIGITSRQGPQTDLRSCRSDEYHTHLVKRFGACARVYGSVNNMSTSLVNVSSPPQVVPCDEITLRVCLVLFNNLYYLNTMNVGQPDLIAAREYMIHKEGRGIIWCELLVVYPSACPIKQPSRRV